MDQISSNATSEKPHFVYASVPRHTSLFFRSGLLCPLHLFAAACSFTSALCIHLYSTLLAVLSFESFLSFRLHPVGLFVLRPCYDQAHHLISLLVLSICLSLLPLLPLSLSLLSSPSPFKPHTGSLLLVRTHPPLAAFNPITRRLARHCTLLLLARFLLSSWRAFALSCLLLVADRPLSHTRTAAGPRLI